jgi:glucose uptake protein
VFFVARAPLPVAFFLDDFSYRGLPEEGDKSPDIGMVISVVVGVLMGLFFYLVQVDIDSDLNNPDHVYMEEFAAVFIFSIGLFISNFLFFITGLGLLIYARIA